MTHRHAMRRNVTPRPGERDLRTLRRLVTRAVKAAACNERHALPFVRAAERAGKCILPVGHQGEASVFVRLIRLGKGWLKLTPETRRANTDLVEDLAARCAAILDDDGGRRERADIEG